MRIMILGGYGTFGGRLAEVLLVYPQIELIIAGRSIEKAQAFCRQLKSERVKPSAVSRTDDVTQILLEQRVDLVVDATGPFQAYGNDPYRLAKQCVAARVNYLDFADGAEFAQGISVLDAQARAAKVWVLSGVSSFPVLTAAVVRRIVSQQGLRPRSVYAGIAPSPYAGFGLNVVKAIAGYAGREIPVVTKGRVTQAHALTSTMRRTVSVPGKLPLDHRLFALVEVPDLLVLKAEHPELQEVWVGAAPVPRILLKCLVWMAFGVRWHLLPRLEFAAPLFHSIINLARWGEHRGGMFVEVQGISSGGRLLTCAWHMLAEGDDGPYIPCMAIEAIVFRHLAGKVVEIGARAATADVELDEYEALFSKRKITTGLRSLDPAQSLYQRILGDAWLQLPLQIQQVHGSQERYVLHGHAEVQRGKRWLSRFLARFAGFPIESKAVSVTVEIERSLHGERWTRDFGGHRLTSVLSSGDGEQSYLLTEKIAGLSFDIALLARDQGIKWQVRSWRWGWLPLPLTWAPNCEATETVRDERYAFDVSLSHWICGLIVAYRGRLESVKA
jgi:hypothetical protein